MMSQSADPSARFEEVVHVTQQTPHPTSPDDSSSLSQPEPEISASVLVPDGVVGHGVSEGEIEPSGESLGTLPGKLPSALPSELQHKPQSGQLIVLTGPSGVGKGTLVKQLRVRYPQLHLSISATTRSPRTGEVEGQDYYFLDRASFEEKIAAGEFVEWAEFAGNYYGTPQASIQTQLDQGLTVLLEIELEGARQVRSLFPQARSIFILPPSFATLEERLRSRGRDPEAAIVRRLARAKEEISAAAEFDVQIVNDDLETALHELEVFLFSQPHTTA